MVSSEKSPLLVRSEKLETGTYSLTPTKNESNLDTGNTGITNTTVLALAFTVFVQSYLLEGVFPYAGFLTMHLLSDGANVNEETVGRYAGYVACSFMAGRTITAVLWGRLADAYGRVFVLEVSLVASAITSLGFGFASTYTEALMWRFLMGVGNGITGTIKCLLSEIKESAGSEASETKTMAIVYGMRGYGFLICPAITGFLSDPMKQYPQTMENAPLWIQSLLLSYPFVLPNLLAFFLCWGAFRLVRDHVEETLPEERRQPVSLSSISKGNVWRSKVTKDGDEEQSTDLLWTSRNNNNHELESQKRRIQGRWFHLYVYWIFSFLNIAADEMLPLFCLSKLSGLGLQEKQISSILGGTTIIYGFFQYFLLTGLVHKLGLYPTLRIGIFFCVPPSILIPLGSLWLTRTTDNGNGSIAGDDFKNNLDADPSNKLTLLMALYLCMIIAATKSFSSVAFSTITMATNKTVDTIDQRATLNGIASFGGSFAKACGPVFAGTLFSYLAGNAASDGINVFAIEPPYGSIVSYGILSVMGFVLGVQTLCLRGNTSSSS